MTGIEAQGPLQGPPGLGEAALQGVDEAEAVEGQDMGGVQRHGLPVALLGAGVVAAAGAAPAVLVEGVGAARRRRLLGREAGCRPGEDGGAGVDGRVPRAERAQAGVHAARTGTRWTTFPRYPLGFQGWRKGWASPVSSKARAQIS